MSNKTKKTVRLIYSSILSVMLIITGILLMAACVNVYNIGDRPFTAENISKEFEKIAAVVWITVGMVAIDAILSVAMPTENGKLRATVNKKTILRRLYSAIDRESLSAEIEEKINKEENLRRILRTSAIVIIGAAAISAAIYAFNMNNFSADYNASVIAACTLILPLAFVGMGVAVIYLFLDAASVDRQLNLVKAAIAKTSRKASAPTKTEHSKNKTSKKITAYTRIIIATAALVFIILGIFNGGVSDVLSKAENICTECIGLG